MKLRLTEEMMERAAAEYENGKSVKDICMELGCATSTFYKRYRMMKDRGEKMPDEPIDSDSALEKSIYGGLSSGEKLERLRRVSEILTDGGYLLRQERHQKSRSEHQRHGEAS